MDDISDGYSNTYLIGEKCRDTVDHYLGETHDPGDNESAFQGHDAETVRYCYDREDFELPPRFGMALFGRQTAIQTLFMHGDRGIRTGST